VGKLFCPNQCCSALMLHSTTLYEEQISIGVFAVTQACCQHGMPSSTEQWGSYFALTSAAVHWCCITAELYEEQIPIGVFAGTQGCCELVLQSCTENWGSLFCTDQCCSALVLQHCTPVLRANLHRCICSDTGLLSAWYAEQH